MKKQASPRKQNSANDHPLHENIALRAYEIYVTRGAFHGHDLDDWLQAERELVAGNKRAIPAIRGHASVHRGELRSAKSER